MKAQIDIINRIIKIGGVYGQIGKIYLSNEENATKFIWECCEQCDVQFAVDVWGDKLVEDIVTFTKRTKTNYNEKNT